MQEEQGSVETTAQTENVADLPAAEKNPVEEAPVKVKKTKKKTSKKKPSIPTVEAVVASETEDEREGSSDAAEKNQESEESVDQVKSPETEETAGGENDSDSPAETISEEKLHEADEEKVSESVRNDAEEETREPEEKYEEEPDSDEMEKEELESRRTNLSTDSEAALLETVLFLESEPQPVEALAKITQLSEDVINDCVARLQEKYADADSGIELSKIIGGWILTPKKECFDLVKERYGKKNEGRLSKAAIETLSIIAYSQPITRAEIESIRHVSADNMMRILIERKFIKEVGKKDIPGKPVMYGTTKEFLEFFHLQSIADLPQLDEKESERFELAR